MTQSPSRCRCAPGGPTGEDIDINPDCPQHGAADDLALEAAATGIAHSVNDREPDDGAYDLATAALKGLRAAGLSVVEARQPSVFRRLLRRLRTYPATNLRWSTDTEPCAAQCGRPVILGELHLAVVLQTQRRLANGDTQDLGGDEVAHLHPECEPTEYDPTLPFRPMNDGIETTGQEHVGDDH